MMLKVVTNCDSQYTFVYNIYTVYGLPLRIFSKNPPRKSNRSVDMHFTEKFLD